MDALTELPDEFKRELEEDAETIGALLHGSRAAGPARPDSDYDVICMASDPQTYFASGLSKGVVPSIPYASPA